MSLGDRPMSLAWAATMNSTKIAVMVSSASAKARDNLADHVALENSQVDGLPCQHPCRGSTVPTDGHPSRAASSC